MANVFMSFLGTNPYLEAHYELKNQVSSPTPFVQEALVELLCSHWEQGRLVFFLTEEAHQKNWQDHGNFETGLKTRLHRLIINRNLPLEIQTVPISEGKSEEEIRTNFLKIIENLQPDEKIYLDITHSFRSLPMLNLVALNFSRVLYRTEIKGIYYGAFETLGHFEKVKKMPVENRIAPVFDLTPYVHLLDFSFAVEEFSRYGLAERLYSLIKGELTPILKETRGQDEAASCLRQQIDSLRNLVLAIYTCRCQKIEETKINLCDEDLLNPLFPHFALLFRHLQDQIQDLSSASSPWDKALAAVKWCVAHNLIPQGYTILQEATISEVCRWAGYKDIYKEEHRNFISALLNVLGSKIPPESWRNPLKRRREEAENLCQKGGETLRKLGKVFNSLTDFRNDINHCGARSGAKQPGKLQSCLAEFCTKIDQIMQELS